ncbi:hypothetical protein KFL_002570110 [Klebsormidium nitens]|uniref:SET domain-containing protein n=1 Tax=Klebsormidium nitens TaxID=105231 RepID=A0A1Y1I5S7_KLENI|nr:hypothetical protein KFL_002570110 [Klebsormidium nitens]|eukprot:GAQ85843.1 hypothetical protein KFL_002570110 [Klebsormidium nitens]
METLQRWAAKNGAEWPRLEAEERTMRSTDALAAGDTLMKIPFAMLMNAQRSFHELPFAAGFQCLSYEGASERTLLCLFVASERAKGVRSFYWPYLRMLPQTFSTPLWYGDEEKAAVAGTRVGAGLRAEEEALDELVRTWGYKFLNAARNGMSYAASLGVLEMTSDDPNAGRAVYRDRYDSCDSDGNVKDDSDGSDRCCDQVIDWYYSDGGEMEEPYTITGNSQQQRERDKKGDHTRDPDGSEPEEMATHVRNMDVAWATVTRENLKWARSVVFSRAFTLKWWPGHTIALVPLFDMLDHSPGARLTWLTDEAKRVVTFSTDAAIPSGQVVFNNYGQKPNEELLQGYGFAILNNPAERFVVKLAMGSGRPSDDSESDDEEEDTTWRKALIDGLGARSLEFKLSMADPLPAAFLDAARLLAMNEQTAYACVQKMDKLREGGSPAGGAGGGGNEGKTKPALGTEGVIPRYPYLDLRVVATLTSLLECSRGSLAGGSVEDDLKLIAILEKRMVQGKSNASERDADGDPPEKRARSEPSDLDNDPGEEPASVVGLNRIEDIEDESKRSDWETETSASDQEIDEEMHEEERNSWREVREHRAKWKLEKRENRKKRRDPYGHREIWAQDDVTGAHAPDAAERLKWAIVYRVGQKQIIEASLNALKDMAASIVTRCCPVVSKPGGYNREPNYAAWCAEKGVQSFAVQELWPVNGPGGQVARSEPASTTPPNVSPVLTTANNSVFDGFTLRPALRVARDCLAGQKLAFIPGGSLLTGEFPKGLKKVLEESVGGSGAGKPGRKRVLAQLKKCPEDVGLALSLMWERSLGPRSEFAAFVDTLVRLPASAVTWDDSALEKLAGTHLHDVISTRREDLREQYEQLIEPAIDARCPSFREAFSEERFLWAMQIVDVYSVEVPPETGAEARGGKRVLAPVLSSLPRPFVGAAVKVRWGGPPKVAKPAKKRPRTEPSGAGVSTNGTEPEPEKESQAAASRAPGDASTSRSADPPGKKKAAGPKRGVWLETACALSGGALLLNPTDGIDSVSLMLDFGADAGPCVLASSADVTPTITHVSKPSVSGAAPSGDICAPVAAPADVSTGTTSGPSASAADVASADDVIPALPWDFAYFEFGCAEGGGLDFGREELGGATNLCGIHYLGEFVATRRLLDAMMVATIGITDEGRFEVEQANAVKEAWKGLQAVGPPEWRARGGTDEAKALAEEHEKRVAAAKAELSAQVGAFEAYLESDEARHVALEAAEGLLPELRENMAGGDAESDRALWKATRERMRVGEAELAMYAVESVERKMAITRLTAQGVNAAVYVYRHRQKRILDKWIRTLRTEKSALDVMMSDS